MKAASEYPRSRHGLIMDTVIADALGRLPFEVDGTRITPIEDDLEVLMWEQVWGDTACGFGGIGGSMMTTAPTVVVACHISGEALVYHAGRFAYWAEQGYRLWDAMQARRLAGQSEPHPPYRLSKRAQKDAAPTPATGP